MGKTAAEYKKTYAEYLAQEEANHGEARQRLQDLTGEHLAALRQLDSAKAGSDFEKYAEARAKASRIEQEIETISAEIRANAAPCPFTAKELAKDWDATNARNNKAITAAIEAAAAAGRDFAAAYKKLLQEYEAAHNEYYAFADIYVKVLPPENTQGEKVTPLAKFPADRREPPFAPANWPPTVLYLYDKRELTEAEAVTANKFINDIS